MAEESEKMKEYFASLQDEVDKTYKIATSARKKKFDPEDRVDIPLAKNMAERVEGLISVVAPQLAGSGMTQRISELEKEYSSMDWRVGFKIAEEVAKEKFCKFSDKREAMEVGIRVGFAYLTGGIVSAPLEGFIELRLKKRRDGKEYFSVCYAGPIRGAGGTASSTSVILSDYVRVKMGYAPYDPDENEVNRYVSEINDYHERVTNLQYKPSDDEVRFMMQHVPVEVNGDPTETIDVSNYKDLSRVETNKIRGGVCLVVAEGLSQKAPKLWKRLAEWGKDFELEWNFLDDFLQLQKKIKSRKKEDDSKEKPKLSPNYTFIMDLVAGRPVLTHPMAEGGFRLRYGRTRTTGFSAAAIHPATQILLNKYVATGTQLKVERPGKAAAMTPCDSIEAPIVLLKDGNVVRIENEKDAQKNVQDVKEILFLGDILFNYGDFSENGHILVPSGYCEEWWIQEFDKKIVDMFGSLDVEKIHDLVDVSTEKLAEVMDKPLFFFPDAKSSVEIARKLKVPLHPRHTFYWKFTSKQNMVKLVEWLCKSEIKYEDEKLKKIILPYKQDEKRILELLGIPHISASNEFVVIKNDEAFALLASLGALTGNFGEIRSKIESVDFTDGLSIVNSLAGFIIRDKAGTFIGARMGRPEKAKMRKLAGNPQVLFPVGEQGGRLRSFQAALEAGKIKSTFPLYRCNKCNQDTIYPVCECCGSESQKLYFCNSCGAIEQRECLKHGTAMSYRTMDLDIKRYFNDALSKVNMKTFPDLIKGVKGTSNKDHVPEHLAKGLLRAKYDIYVNKDGTTRYDMSELPITHFKPKEIKTSVERLKNLGYTHDMMNRPLENDDQILELKPQDVILPSNTESADETGDDVMFKVARFIDDLLENFYGLQPYYNLKSKADLAGHLVIGLAPHISAGMIGRIIGFSETQGCYAHPMWHAALRRDCDGDECCVILLLDAFLNFSRQYLPDKRGGRTMDAPLVLTCKLIPSQVDDQAHGVDVVSRYPLEFYEAAQQYKFPWEVKVEQIKHRLGTELQYEKINFVHPVSDINCGVKCSAYKLLPSMQEKLEGQMDLASKIRAVDATNVAQLVIDKHFLKDTKGNLRKFSQQQFRCVGCNEKFRRPPLRGKCIKCGGKLLFTISEGSVIKYLEPSLSLARQFNVPEYVKQTLEILQRRVEGMFGKEKEKQEGLGKWFG